MGPLTGAQAPGSLLTRLRTAALTKSFLCVAAFESFDLPEEHRIAQLPLNGVPLMILEEERELERLLHFGPPSPLKMPTPLWESGKCPRALLAGLRAVSTRTLASPWGQSCERLAYQSLVPFKPQEGVSEQWKLFSVRTAF